MTENKAYYRIFEASHPLKRILCLASVCAVFAVTGCGKLDFLHPNEDNALTKETKNLRKQIDNSRKGQDPRAYNTKNIFGKSLRSDEERINRLERAVQDMRNEFDNVQPSIKRLTALEGEIKTLVNELKILNSGDPANIMAMQSPQMPAKPQVNKPVTQQPKPVFRKQAQSNYQKKSPPPSTGGKATVYDLRFGEHSGRTRMVMDVNSKTNYSVDIDNNENIMVIDLPNANWTAAKSGSLAKSGFVSSYKVEASETGHILILQLKRNAKVTYQKDLNGTQGNSRRLVIDLQGA